MDKLEKISEEIIEQFKIFMPEQIAPEDPKQLAMYTAYHKVLELKQEINKTLNQHNI